MSQIEREPARPARPTRGILPHPRLDAASGLMERAILGPARPPLGCKHGPTTYVPHPNDHSKGRTTARSVPQQEACHLARTVPLQESCQWRWAVSVPRGTGGVDPFPSPRANCPDTWNGGAAHWPCKDPLSRD